MDTTESEKLKPASPDKVGEDSEESTSPVDNYKLIIEGLSNLLLKSESNQEKIWKIKSKKLSRLQPINSSGYN